MDKFFLYSLPLNKSLVQKFFLYMFGYFLAMVEEGRFFQVDTFPPCYS